MRHKPGRLLARQLRAPKEKSWRALYGGEAVNRVRSLRQSALGYTPIHITIPHITLCLAFRGSCILTYAYHPSLQAGTFLHTFHHHGSPYTCKKEEALPSSFNKSIHSAELGIKQRIHCSDSP